MSSPQQVGLTRATVCIRYSENKETSGSIASCHVASRHLIPGGGEVEEAIREHSGPHAHWLCMTFDFYCFSFPPPNLRNMEADVSCLLLRCSLYAV